MVRRGHGRRLSRKGAQNGTHTLSRQQPISGSVDALRHSPVIRLTNSLDQAMVRSLVTHRG